MSPAGSRDASTIRRLVGIYDASGTLGGELAYWVGARLGRAHCALCDITHGLARERSEWKACKLGLPVRFDTYHRNDQPAEMRTVAGRLPAVVAETGDGPTLLLGPEDLAACDGSPQKLVLSIEQAVERAGLHWTQ